MGVDHDRVAADYERARGLDPAGLEEWRAAVGRHAPRGGWVLDPGSGTGASPSLADLADLAERVRLRADSTLVDLPETELRAGRGALERAAAAEVEPAPVIDAIDLLVLR